jgi:DNA topoisomerase-1
MEDTLDDISNGAATKLPILNEFWHNLEKLIQEKQGINRTELTAEKLDEECPQCNKPLLVRLGKYGKFIGCSGYPECNYMRKIDNGNSTDGEQSQAAAPEIVDGRICPQDGGTLVVRTGKYGKFISCANYPKCKYIENLNKPDDLGITCPECSKGQIVAKKNRYGNWFYACNTYPQCKTIFNHKPLAKNCPSCNYPVMLHKTTKTKGEEEICPKCSHSISL